METNSGTSKKSRERLFRSKGDRLIGGVCGGIAERLNIDPLIVRIGWVFMTLFAGAGIIVYIAALIIIPENPAQEYSARRHKRSSDSAKLWGTLLIIFGGILLLKQTGILYNLHFWAVPWQAVIAVLLIGFGAYILFNKKTEKNQDNAGYPDDLYEEATQDTNSNRSDFFRIEENKMIAGVCTGLARYFDMDVTLVRLIWVFATLASGGLTILAYLIAVIVFPAMAPQIKDGGRL